MPLHDIYYSERLFEREKKKKRGVVTGYYVMPNKYCSMELNL